MANKYVSLADFEEGARRRLPRMVFDYVQGGAESENTIYSNNRALNSLRLQPRVFNDVSTRNLSVTIAGEKFKLPVILSPVGLAGIAYSHGECEAAAAAADCGTVSTVSTASSDSLERIAGSVSRSQWFQLYPWGNRQAVESLIQRAIASDYSIMVVTADVPVTGSRERDLVNGMTIPPRPSTRNVANLLRHPRWLARFSFGAPINFANLSDQSSRRGVATLAKRHEGLLNPGHTWEDLRWMTSLWPGKVLVKGITHPDDARRAVDAGCDGVIVSNHGGRQLDHMEGTMESLPAVANAIGHNSEVLVDGGIRRGTDVVKALALGASAVMIGRPWVYGLAVNGGAGVRRCLDILYEEIDRTLALLGVTDIADLTSSQLK